MPVSPLERQFERLLIPIALILIAGIIAYVLG